MDSVNILVCEDERIFALELEERLRKMGHRVVGTVANGKDAIEMAGKLRPDLALMDIRLEGEIPGTEVADVLKKQYSIPSIFLTAFADGETIDQAKIAQPLGYLVKPVNDRSLELAIEFGMSQHGLQKTLKTELEMYRALSERLIELGGEQEGEDEDFEAQRSLDDLSDIVGSLAHHINNSLASIQGNLEFLSGCKTLEGYERGFVDRALQGCEKQRMLVQRLLWASQEGPRCLEVVRLHQLLIEAADAARHYLKAGVRLSVAYLSPETSCFVDKRAVYHSAVGLLLNANDAIEGEGEISLELISEYVDNPKAHNPRAVPGWFSVIRVSDSGRGISPEEISSVCKPFFTTQNHPNAAGLGLSVAYGVAHGHGGWLAIDSRPGKGTTMNMFIPQMQSSSRESAQIT